jgi:hypothetical protein
LVALAACAAQLAGTTNQVIAKSPNAPDSNVNDVVRYSWNLNDRELPLLQLPEQLHEDFDRTLGYPLDQFRSVPVFQTIIFEKYYGRYILPVSANKGLPKYVQFEPITPRVYASVDGTNLQLDDDDTLKTVRTSTGAKYLFVRYADGKFRCATILDAGGASLNMLYSVTDFRLRGVADSSGRRVTFNYDLKGIQSVSQTWKAESRGFARTWSINGSPSDVESAALEVRPARLVSSKSVPDNALVRNYTSAMAESDELLARIFGGPNAVAGGNSFEPIALGPSYPRYRGDVVGADGAKRQGHLSYAIHLYGNQNGTGDSPLYVPAGFTCYTFPSSRDAVATFYYPQLGDLSDVTVAVFHLADFRISYEGDRVRIGMIGGPGGSSPSYKHSHIEFYKGKNVLPSPEARATLRIKPSTVFGTLLARVSKPASQ